MKFLRRIALMALLIGVQSAHGLTMDEVETLSGKLALSRTETPDGVTITATLEGKELFRELDYVWASIIHSPGSTKPTKFVLVELGPGGHSCLAEYRVVEASGNGASVSELFGNCGDGAKARVQGQCFLVTIPRSGLNPPEKWVYSNGKLARYTSKAKCK